MKFRLKILSLLSLLFLTSCITTSQVIQDDFPSRILLAPQDLPANWAREDIFIEEIPNGKSRMVVYNAENQPTKLYLVLSHTLNVYTTEEEATNAYKAMNEEYFPTNDWKTPENIGAFAPNDLYHLACFRLSMNGDSFNSCRYLQVHKNFISLVMGNIDEKDITLEQFINALKIIDIRMQQHEQ